MTVMDMVSCRLLTHTRDAQATTVSIFILHTLTLFAECRTSPGTAAGKPLPKSKTYSGKFCSVFKNTFHGAEWYLLIQSLTVM